MTMATRGQGIAVIYGRAHDSVTALYAVMKDRERIDWPVHDDAESGERYFAVIADCEAIADIVATAPAKKASLKDQRRHRLSDSSRSGSARPASAGPKLRKPGLNRTTRSVRPIAWNSQPLTPLISDILHGRRPWPPPRVITFGGVL